MEENKISIFQFKWMILIQYHALGPVVHVIYFSIGLTALNLKLHWTSSYNTWLAWKFGFAHIFVFFRNFAQNSSPS